MKKQPHAIKWKSILGLLLLLPAIVLEWQWVWGVLFLFWATFDLMARKTYFMEEVTRRDDPLLYWVIVVTWLALAVLSFFY